jgi:cytochrome oxidase Cu insertion factor (SCO1/SenC/PrrC family)
LRGVIPKKLGCPDAACAKTARGGVDLLRETPMTINDKAPDFSLQDQNGTTVALKDLRGKTVILFFYPRANTPG